MLAIDGMPIGPTSSFDSLLSLTRSENASWCACRRRKGENVARRCAPARERGHREARYSIAHGSNETPRDTSRRSAAAGSATCTWRTWAAARSTSSISISTARTTSKDGMVFDIRNNNGGFVNGLRTRYAEPPAVREHGAARRAVSAGPPGAWPARARGANDSRHEPGTRCPTARISPRDIAR